MLLKPARLPLFPLIVAREKLARGERTRTVGGEPAVMDEPQGVKEYDELGAGAEAGQHLFCARAISRLLPEGGTLLDLGCGSARLLEQLAHGRPDARIIGLDLSEPMLETGRRRLEAEGLSDRIELRRCDITTFDTEVSDDVDVVSCNFALHHLPDEETALKCFEAIARMRSRTGCAVWLFDFARLRSAETWPAVCSMISWPGPVVYNDAIESERAAFSHAEMTALLERAGLRDLEHLQARPLRELQVHYAHGADRREPVTGLWRERPLSRQTRLLLRFVTQSFPRSLTRT
jgi:ubiquinone/menaquinone biosynthesis C-methylase UbiE